MLGAIAIFATVFLMVVRGDQMPAPFTRVLSVTTPYMQGNDVTIAQTLLKRDSSVDPNLVVDGVYGQDSANAVSAFQAAVGLKATGVFESTTAQTLLDKHTADGIKDSGFKASTYGYLFKLHIPVHNNRSIETYPTLYDKDNKVLLEFRARTHGVRDDGTQSAWPDFGDGDVGYTQYGGSGNTVTGVIEVDLNTPEPDPDVYGPWNVLRFVRASTLESGPGNAFVLPNIRDGLLMHTGNWTSDAHPWNPTMDMPNSNGCIHVHPEDMKKIGELLAGLGVKANTNPFSGKNYPYQPQGIAVIELID